MCSLNIAITYSNLGRFDKALEYLEPCLVARRKLFGEDHEQTCACVHTTALSKQFWYDVTLFVAGEVMNCLALTYCELKRHEDALPLQTQVLELRKRTMPADDPRIGIHALRTSLQLWNLFSR